MTALVHPLSCACGKSELELFAVPPTQTAINSSQWMEYRPITSLTDTGPIEFVITGSGEEYVDLSETYLQVTAKIVKPTGGDLEQTLDDSGTVNGNWCGCRTGQPMAPLPFQPSGCQFEWPLGHTIHEHLSLSELI